MHRGSGCSWIFPEQLCNRTWKQWYAGSSDCKEQHGFDSIYGIFPGSFKIGRYGNAAVNRHLHVFFFDFVVNWNAVFIIIATMETAFQFTKKRKKKTEGKKEDKA